MIRFLLCITNRLKTCGKNVVVIVVGRHLSTRLKRALPTSTVDSANPVPTTHTSTLWASINTTGEDPLRP